MGLSDYRNASVKHWVTKPSNSGNKIVVAGNMMNITILPIIAMVVH